jgi:hypothetical protein
MPAQIAAELRLALSARSRRKARRRNLTAARESKFDQFVGETLVDVASIEVRKRLSDVDRRLEKLHEQVGTIVLIAVRQ